MSAPLTDAELAEIAGRSAAATPGPWEIEWDSCDCGGDYPCSHGEWPYTLYAPEKRVTRSVGTDWEREEAAEIANFADAQDGTEADALFIAHSREDVDRLLAEIVRLKAELAQYAGMRTRQEVEKRGTGGYCVHRDAQGRLGCMAPQQRDSVYCYQHDPARAATRQAAAAKARESRRQNEAWRAGNAKRWQERPE